MQIDVTGTVHTNTGTATRDVLVSNGREIVRTDSAGGFRLPARPGDFVQVTVPAGYRAPAGFYRRVPPTATGGSIRFDFCLEAFPEQKQDDFTVVHIGDVHLHNTWGGFERPEQSEQAVIAACAEINALQPRPEFAICTGDLPTRGFAEEQYAAAARVFSTLDMPFVYTIGNHEKCGTAETSQLPVHYFGLAEHYYGPPQYGFEWGRYHFISIDMNRINDCFDEHPVYRGEYRKWVENYLAQLDPEQPKIVSIHTFRSSDETAFLDTLVEAKVVAIIAGDEHLNYRYEYRGVPYVCTSSFIMAGQAGSPRGFRVLHLHDGAVATRTVTGGVRRHLAVVPAADRIEARAYDTSARIESVTCTLANGDTVPLQPRGKWGWTAPRPSTEERPARIAAAADNGDSWEVSVDLAAGDEAADPAPAESWRQFLGHADRCGVASSVVEPPLAIAWCRFLGGDVCLSSPVVHDDSVCIATADDDNGRQQGLVALDSVSGEIKWHARTTSSIKHTPALFENTVVGLTEFGDCVAVDLETGEKLWTRSFGSPISTRVLSSPLVAGGKLYVNGGGPVFACLDPASGRELWRVDDLPGYNVFWQQQCPSLADAVLYAGSGAGIRALDAETGATIWERTLWEGSFRITTTPVAGRNCLLYGALDGTFGAIDRATGEFVWKNRTPGSEKYTHRIVTGSAAYRDGVFYTGLGNGDVVAVTEDTGEVLWRIATGMAIYTVGHAMRDEPGVCASPGISGGVLYIGANDGVLRGIDIADGSLIWSCPLGVPIASSPAISGNALYIASADGHMYAFTPPRGHGK
jgi:outer membrane protein assembly factor BamB